MEPNKPLKISNQLSKVSRTNLFMSTVLTVFVIGAMIATMLVQVDFDIREINWFDFSFSIFNWLIARITYFPAGVDIGNKDENVQIMVNTLNKYRNVIYKAKINKEFRAKIEKYNKISKCSAYIDALDYKLTTTKNRTMLMKYNELKIQALELLPFLEKGEIEKYEGTLNIDAIRVQYDKLDFANIFSFGTTTRMIGKKYQFNAEAEAVSRSYLQFMVTIVFSFLNASLVVLQYGFTMLSLYMFLTKVVMFVLGAYHGLKLGNEIIVETKYAVMLNLADRTKEILNEIEKEQNVDLEKMLLETKTA